MTTTVICVGCDEPVDENDVYCGALDAEPLCPGCYESDLSNGSTLTRFDPDGTYDTVRFGDHDAVGTDGDVPDWFTALLPTPWEGRVYVSTDGWRGYHNTITVLDLVPVESGWVTGDYDDVPWKKDTHRFAQALVDGDLTPPVPLYILTEPTSNVFSIATDIACSPDDVDAIRAWLDSTDFDLHRALG